MPDLKKKSYDHTLLVTLFLIMIIGLVILYSTSAYNGEVKFHDSFYYLKKQLFATGLGVVAMFVMAGTDYHFWKKFAIPAYLGAILLSIAVVLFGDEYNGSKRWLSLGTVFISTVRICQGGSYSVPGISCDEKCGENEQYLDDASDYAVCTAGSWSGGGQ